MISECFSKITKLKHQTFKFTDAMTRSAALHLLKQEVRDRANKCTQLELVDTELYHHQEARAQSVNDQT